jgi:hypothetical protein
VLNAAPQVAGTYYDASKEAEYQRQVRVLEKVHGAGQLARLPPSVSYSEGAAFNIVTQDARDPEKLAAVEGAGNRRFASKKGAMVKLATLKSLWVADGGFVLMGGRNTVIAVFPP